MAGTPRPTDSANGHPTRVPINSRRRTRIACAIDVIDRNEPGEHEAHDGSAEREFVGQDAFFQIGEESGRPAAPTSRHNLTATTVGPRAVTIAKNSTPVSSSTSG